MKIAYFDCFSGISGDMTLGAFLDAGLKLGTLSRELAKLKLKGYRLRAAKVTRGGISGTKFDCVTDNAPHAHRSLKDITSLIDRSSLGGRVKDTAKKIFQAIAAAEAKVHGKERARDIIFHELGDTDSIVDIVGTAIAVDKLGIDAVYSSKVNMGRTIVASRHGNIPAPSPASLELLKGFPVSVSDIEAELVTPTGAGILKALSKNSGPIPQLEIAGIGYGAGSKEISERPNMLRVLIGEIKPAFKEDNVYVIETNIDDMNPQHVGYVIEKLLGAGAVDAYITNIQMKKARPAFKLTAIADATKLQKAASVIFSETPAIGLRFYEANRMKLDRKSAKVKTAYGELKVKVSKGPDSLLTVSPEHDECVKAAREKNVPLRKVYEAAKLAARASLLLAFLLLGLWSMAYRPAYADVVVTNGGEELKGIVVEDYNDRIVISTISGEKTIMKSDIKELYYDEEEENLIKLADQAKEKRDYIRALTYYDMAFRKNPNSKAAKDGLVFLEGYLFRKEQAQKEDDIRKRDELENRNVTIPTQPTGEEEISEKTAALRKVLGITLDIVNGFPQVVTIQSHSPASEAGVLKGDKIAAIWARLTGYMELREVLNALLDKPSLELKCTIERTIEVPLKHYILIAPGTKELIGIVLSMEFNGLTVASVVEGSPAYDAGLKKGDLVTAINGKSTRYTPLKKAIDAIRSVKEDTVTLTVRRETLIWRRD